MGHPEQHAARVAMLRGSLFARLLRYACICSLHSHHFAALVRLLLFLDQNKSTKLF